MNQLLTFHEDAKFDYLEKKILKDDRINQLEKNIESLEEKHKRISSDM